MTDGRIINSILEFNPVWPNCKFLEKTDRRRRASDGFDISRYIDDNLADWHNELEIAIDGLSGGGKSTLIHSLNRAYQKVNNIAIPITQGSDYNHDPLKAMSYLFSQLVCIANKPICWDRSTYSNLIFHYVHLLMAHYLERDINVRDLTTNFRILNSFAQDLHLIDTLEIVRQHKPMRVLFIVNTDLEVAGLNLLQRGTLNDVYNAKEYNYLAAQCLVFMWFAEILKAPCIDLNACAFNDSFTLTDLHALLRNKLNYRKDESASVGPAITLNVHPTLVETNDWINRTMAPMHKNNGLMYKYSAK